jgi:hypothetical protein
VYPLLDPDPDPDPEEDVCPQITQIDPDPTEPDWPTEHTDQNGSIS